MKNQYKWRITVSDILIRVQCPTCYHIENVNAEAFLKDEQGGTPSYHKACWDHGDESRFAKIEDINKDFFTLRVNADEYEDGDELHVMFVRADMAIDQERAEAKYRMRVEDGEARIGVNKESLIFVKCRNIEFMSQLFEDANNYHKLIKHNRVVKEAITTQVNRLEEDSL